MSRDQSVVARALINTGLQPGELGKSISAVSTAFGRITLGSEKVQRNVRFITNDPAVVRHRRNVKYVACAKLNYSTIVERNGRYSRENKPDVFNGTTRRANTRADVLAPFPAWLIGRTTNCDST